jgi:hypothetical protein
MRAPARLSRLRAAGDDGLSPADEIRIDELVAEAAAAAWYCAFEPSRDCLTLAQGNAIAEVILDAHVAGEDVHAALATSSLFPRNEVWPVAREVARDLVRRYDEDLQDLTRREHAALLSELACRIEPVLASADTSTPAMPSPGAIVPKSCSSCRPRVSIRWTPALPATGHGPNLPKCMSPKISSMPWPRLATPSATIARPAAMPMHRSGPGQGPHRQAGLPASPDTAVQSRGRSRDGRQCLLHELSLRALRHGSDRAADRSRSRQAGQLQPGGDRDLGSWNGTFHDAVSVPAVTVTPSMGTLMSPARWYSPDHICGFVHSCYTGDIGQGGEGRRSGPDGNERRIVGLSGHFDRWRRTAAILVGEGIRGQQPS